MKTEIYIGTDQCDYEDELNVDYSISDIKNLTGRNVPASLPINLPMTDRNKEIFKFVNEANVFTEITDTGEVYINGSLYLSGKVKLIETEDYFKINIFHKGWIDELAEVKLADLDWSDDDHTYNKATIDDSEDPDTTGKNYLYPLIDYGQWAGNWQGLTPVVIDQRYPATKVKGIIENIFAYAGYTLSSAFISGDHFKRLYLPYTKSRKIYTDEWIDEREFRADLSGDENNVQSIPNGVGPVALLMFNGNTVNNELVPYANDSTDPNFDTGANYNKVTYKYTIDGTGSYRFLAAVEFNYQVSPILTLANNVLKIEIIKDSGGETVLATDTDNTTLVTGCGAGTINLTLDSGFDYITDAFDIFVRVTLTGTATNGSDDPEDYMLDLKDNTDTYFYNEVGAWYANGQSITYLNMVPDIKCIEFLKAVIHTHNLIIFTNILNKTVYLEERDSFYTDEQIDWSEKTDRYEKVNQKFISNDYNKLIRFKYMEDPNDSKVKKWQDDNNDFLDSYLHTLDSVYTQDGEQTEENPLFGATLLKNMWSIGIGIDEIPVITGTDEAFLPKILRYDYDDTNSGPTDLQGGNTWDFEGDTRTTFPKMTALDYEDLYDYYFNDIELIDKGKIITAYMVLDSHEYQKFITVVADSTKEGFRPVYKIDFDDTVTYCRINRIVTNGKKTKVEFIKIKYQE